MLAGMVGEFKTKILNSIGLSSDFYIINNVTIPNGLNPNETTQMDSILISKTKPLIVVVEVKNYNCHIIGNVEERQWKSIYSKNKIFDTYNPLFQNYGHIKAIQSLLKNHELNLPISQFQSIVYFNGNDKLDISDSNKQEVSHLFSKKCLISNYKQYREIIKKINKDAYGLEQHKEIQKNIFEILEKENLTNGLNLKSISNQIKHVEQVKSYRNTIK